MSEFTKTRSQIASWTRVRPADDPELVRAQKKMTAISIEMSIDKILAKGHGLEVEDAAKLIDKLLAAIK